MYLDESIKIVGVPNTLQELLDEMDEYYRTGDDCMFAVRADDLEGITKQNCILGDISESQLDQIFRRYGLR